MSDNIHVSEIGTDERHEERSGAVEDTASHQRACFGSVNRLPFLSINSTEKCGNHFLSPYRLRADDFDTSSISTYASSARSHDNSSISACESQCNKQLNSYAQKFTPGKDFNSAQNISESRQRKSNSSTKSTKT